MHAEIAVSQSGLVVFQTSALVMQISSAALHAECGAVPVGLAVLQTGMAVDPQRLGKAPPGIVVMHGGSGTTTEGIAMVRHQPAEIQTGCTIIFSYSAVRQRAISCGSCLSRRARWPSATSDAASAGSS
jgi:hypothetical protein